MGLSNVVFSASVAHNSIRTWMALCQSVYLLISLATAVVYRCPSQQQWQYQGKHEGEPASYLVCAVADGHSFRVVYGVSVYDSCRRHPILELLPCDAVEEAVCSTGMCGVLTIQ